MNEKAKLKELIDKYGYSQVYMAYIDNKWPIEKIEEVFAEHEHRKKLMEELRP